jgi:hypothetical protein
LGAAVTTLVLGFAAVGLIVTLRWDHLGQWVQMSVWWRLAIVAPMVALTIVVAIYLWARHKFVSIGVLLYLMVDFWMVVR